MAAGLASEMDDEDDLVVIGRAQDGRQAITEARRLRPDVILMDIQMPRMNGLEALRQIISEHPDVYVLIVTAHHEEANLLAAIDSGAHGFITKSDVTLPLPTAIRDALKGGTPVTSSVTTKLWQRERKHDPLTPRELEILQLAVQEYTDQAIATELHIAKRTVENHWVRIRQKLDDAPDKPGAIVRALQRHIVTLKP